MAGKKYYITMYYITYQYLCCWRPFSSWWVTVAGLSAIAGIPGDAIISEVSFQLTVVGGPAVIGFPAVDGIIAVASIPADPGVPIFSWWLFILDGTMRHITRLSNYSYHSNLSSNLGHAHSFLSSNLGHALSNLSSNLGRTHSNLSNAWGAPSPINQTTWGVPTPIYQATWGVPSPTNQTMCPELRVNRRIAQPGPVRTRALQYSACFLPV